MNVVFATPSVGEYTGAAICYGLIECFLRGGHDLAPEVYSRGTLHEVSCGLGLPVAETAIHDGLVDALDEILEGAAFSRRLAWVYGAAAGGLQPNDKNVAEGLEHLREVRSAAVKPELGEFLIELSNCAHVCRTGWTSLAIVPEWGRQEKELFRSPNRGSKLCRWCYGLAWVGLHNFAQFVRHQRNRDVSCTVALMIPAPSERLYTSYELLCARELATRYQREERPFEAPPPFQAFMLWALSRGETVLPLDLSGRSFLAAAVRFERTGRPPQYSVAVRGFQVAPVWRLLRFVAEAKRRTFGFHPLVDTLLRQDGGVDGDVVQLLAESVIYADVDGVYRALRGARRAAERRELRVEPGVVDAAFRAIS